MPLEPPPWWYGPSTAANRTVAAALAPVAAVYAAATARRFANARPFRAPFPVVCIGNLTAGGTGKTPLARAIGAMARRLGHTPAFLTRGYKGRTSGPVWVDPASHTARDVGDEPLLLARDLPTVVARDRAAGARFIAQTRSDVDLLIMDDGLQNPALVKDLAIAVVDGRRGIGNARVIPSGPLRAPLAFQRALVDLVIVNAGSGPGNEAATLGNVFEPPVEAYAMRVVPRDPDWRAGAARAIAYAGIGNPENFFATLRTIGIDLVETRAYPDHHAWRDADILDLLGRARRHGVPLVTTEKDHARLDTRRKSEAALAEASRVLAIDVVLEEAAATAIEARLARLTT